MDAPPTGTGKWHTLVHVCQRWRYAVFASPRLLNLRLEYTGKRPMSEMLQVWPVLPVVTIVATRPFESYHNFCLGNIVDFLESEDHHRICEIDLSGIPTSHWKRFAAAMEKPFPQLTSLRLSVEEDSKTSLPDSFLGGSAPLLRQLLLTNCLFPGMRKLLLSAHNLVTLRLWNIPDSGYFSPQELVSALSVAARLESVCVEFQSYRDLPIPEIRFPPPPVTRSVLPALTELVFDGVQEFLEDLLARIEAPLLYKLEITLWMDDNFVVPQLHQFIGRTESFKTCDKAWVYPPGHAVQIGIFRDPLPSPTLFLQIINGELSSLAQVCTSSFHLLSTLLKLDIVDPFPPNPQSPWEDYIEPHLCLELLDPFTDVKDLCLYGRLGRYVCQALEELVEGRATEALPVLQNIFLSDLEPSESVPKSIERFVAARQLSGHPVAVYPAGDLPKMLF
ncbi:hypothetical protein F5148DRAFT_64125 [Russula earlei]|uniref:Uncharacterized protein n=1 Tax=Russula earlei TaxID=71964 RepID=A0ACC0UAG8_9AGAM|nr:hypothetical protein F5148DRAFT_64125 [Russula earlei]